MAGFTFYDAVVPAYQQVLGAVAGLLDKAEAHCAERGIDPAEIIAARLADDMHDFAYQVKSVAVHSLGAIEGVRRGSFSPDTSTPPDSFAGLKARITETRAGIDALERDEIDGFVGRDMIFAFGSHRIGFTAEDFLLSFSQPNFYFHATTTYDILRWKGLTIGKTDYMGRQRRKPKAAG